MKKIKISNVYNKVKYILVPFNIDTKELNIFNYIILFVNDKGNFEEHFYTYNHVLDKNSLIAKKEISLFEETECYLNLKDPKEKFDEHHKFKEVFYLKSFVKGIFISLK